MINPKVTIITICYNSSDTIEKTIQSVLQQTYSNIEYIVVDGGSKDGTLDIIRNYASRIAKFISEPDNGIYDAMNKGITLSTGDWINFMNAGDTFVDDNVINRVFSYIDINSRTKVVYGNACLIYPNCGRVKRYYGDSNGIDIPFNICHQASFIDGSLLRQLKYDQSFKIAADVNGFYKIYKLGYSFKFVDEYIANFETFCGLSSNSIYKLADEYRRIRGYKKLSIYWLRSIMKIFLRYLRVKLIPTHKLEMIEYNRIKEKFER